MGTVLAQGQGAGSTDFSATPAPRVTTLLDQLGHFRTATFTQRNQLPVSDLEALVGFLAPAPVMSTLWPQLYSLELTQCE